VFSDNKAHVQNRTGLTVIHLQVWDAFEGENLFTGRDPEHNAYRGRAHLAEMIALLGPPPPGLLARANLRSKFFDEEGELEPCTATACGGSNPYQITLTTRF
jgi:hypothetical protein